MPIRTANITEQNSYRSQPTIKYFSKGGPYIQPNNPGLSSQQMKLVEIKVQSGNQDSESALSPSFPIATSESSNGQRRRRVLKKKAKVQDLKSSNSGRKAMNAENHFPWTLPLSAECSACYFPIVLSDSPLWIHCKPTLTHPVQFISISSLSNSYLIQNP